MSQPIECFLLEPSAKCRVSLRRYQRGKTSCTYLGGAPHDADVFIGVETHEEPPMTGDTRSHADPRWPTKCAHCPYEFQEGDYWQVNFSRLYLAPNGNEYTLLGEHYMTSDREHFAPPGAIWRATWLEPYWVGPDGHSYVIRTPGGDWHIDGQAADNTRWTRTGVAPKLTARPSILCGKRQDGSWIYHGWLTDGRLIEC